MSDIERMAAALPAKAAPAEGMDRLTLSERDSLRVFALLEDPPAAPGRLARAAKAGFTLAVANDAIKRGS